MLFNLAAFYALSLIFPYYQENLKTFNDFGVEMVFEQGSGNIGQT